MARVCKLDIDFGDGCVEDWVTEGGWFIHWLWLVVIGLLFFVGRLFLTLLLALFLWHIDRRVFELLIKFNQL